MKKQWNRLVVLLVICIAFGAHTAFAADMEDTTRQAGALLADSCRILTGSEIAVVSRAAVQESLEADTGNIAHNGVVVKRLSGQDVYDLIGTTVAEGGARYPYFSGVRAVIQTLSGDGGARSERLEGLYIAETPIDFEAKYTVAMSEVYASAYETYETVGSYTPDTVQLGKYVASYAGDAAPVQQESGAAIADETPAVEPTGEEILHNQFMILCTALGVLVVALVIYLYLRHKKKKEETEKSL